jgi:transcriptional regulator with XRE-family HTH domain
MAKKNSVPDTSVQRRLRANLHILVAAMKGGGRSQKAIAQAAKMSGPYLNQVLKGRRAVTLDVIELLAPVLGMPADEIVSRDLSGRTPPRKGDPHDTTSIAQLAPHLDPEVFRLMYRLFLAIQEEFPGVAPPPSSAPGRPDAGGPKGRRRAQGPQPLYVPLYVRHA